MSKHRCRRTLGVLAVVAMAATPLALGAFGAPAGAAGSVTVATPAELESAWEDGANTTITLTADISITGGDCPGGWERSSGSGITVDGQGTFGIVSTCGFGRILLDSTTESVTLTGLTHFDGGFECGPGGGIAANGPVTAINSSFADNVSTGLCECGTSDAVAACAAGDVHAAGPGYRGGAIYSADDVILTNATFSGNHADWEGGAVYSETDATVTGSVFTGNSAGMSGELEMYLAGGALSAPGVIAVTGSTFDGNWIGDAEGNLCSLCGPTGGAIANGSIQAGAAATANPSVTVADSTFSDNHTDCEHYCLSTGGAISGTGPVTTSGSTFTGNTVDIMDCAEAGEAQCYNLGGAIFAPLVTDTGSTFTDNHADTQGCGSAPCWNQGGAITTGEVHLTGTTVTDNSAACDSNCASYGGGVYAGDLDGPSGASTAASSWAGSGVGTAAVIPLGVMTITQSTIAGNVSSCETTNCGVSGGGVLFEDPVSVDVSASTFSGNSAQYAGALGVFTDGAPVTLTNSTITGNSSSWIGAVGLSDAEASLAYDTIVGNTVVAPPPDAILDSASAGGPAWGGVQASVPRETPSPANLSGSAATVFGTIVALPLGGENCAVDATTSQGYNWSDDTSCGFTDATDKVATPNDPGLNALGDWGGPTPTMLPLTPRFGGVTSPVIDAIPAAACQTGVAAGITTDQRGVTRPQLVGCDIGAVEVTEDDYQVEALVVTPRFTG